MPNQQDKRFKNSKSPLSRNLGMKVSLFSYTIKRTSPTLTLRQKDTGFSLVLEMEKLEKTLRITRFKLIKNPQLEKASQDLHDAADIEMTLQALIYLFACAKRHEMGELLFVLPQDEAVQISSFEGLFEEMSPLTLREEKRVSLTLSCSFQDYFLEQLADIKSKIHHELWVRQREDHVLKYYLQNRHNEGFSLFQNITVPKPQPVGGCMIIAFPRKSQQGNVKMSLP